MVDICFGFKERNKMRCHVEKYSGDEKEEKTDGENVLASLQLEHRLKAELKNKS